MTDNARTAQAGADAPRAAQQPNAKSPDMQVAMRIVAKLEVRDLIAPEQSAALRARIAGGALAPEDWVLISRQAIHRETDDGASYD